MLPGTVQNQDELKIVLLLILENCMNPVRNDILSDVVQELLISDFFSCSLALSDLVSSGHIAQSSYESRSYYTISPSGLEAVSLLCTNIKYHQRRLALEASEYIRSKIDSAENIEADYFPVGDSYIVRLSLSDSGSELFSVKIKAASKDSAIKLKDKFTSEAERLVPIITSILTEEK